MTEFEIGLKPQELLIENPNPSARRRGRMRVIVRGIAGLCALTATTAVLTGMTFEPVHKLSISLQQVAEAVQELEKDETIVEAAAETGKSVSKMAEELSEEYVARVAHAKELLGKYYQGSVVRHTEQAKGVDQFIRKELNSRLKGKWKRSSRKIQKVIIQESLKHGFDPLFLMAVIDNESSFRVDVVGGVGEIGLMQLRPQTAKWVAKKFDLPWKGPSSLRDPIVNIRLGSAYLAFLRKRFDSHGRLYLAAYNMGSGGVKRALGKNIWPKDYASAVMDRYIRLYTDLKATIPDGEETT